MIKNKYYKWYYNIIKNAQSRNKSLEYYESHHIIPKSLGGTNDKNNLVDLTAREHFICHFLLTKFTTGESRYKMIYACQGMKRSRNYQDRYINSRLYEVIKKEAAKIQSEKFLGKKLSQEHKDKISQKLIGRKQSIEEIQKRAESLRGKIRTKEQKLRMSEAQKCKKPLSDEQKLISKQKASPKISAKLLGIPKSESHKKSLSESLKGKTKGIPKSEEAKQNMRKPKSEAHKKAISEGRKKDFLKIRSSDHLETL